MTNYSIFELWMFSAKNVNKVFFSSKSFGLTFDLSRPFLVEWYSICKACRILGKMSYLKFRILLIMVSPILWNSGWGGVWGSENSRPRLEFLMDDLKPLPLSNSNSKRPPPQPWNSSCHGQLVCNGFLRFTSGATPAIILVASIAPDLLFSRTWNSTVAWEIIIVRCSGCRFHFHWLTV